MLDPANIIYFYVIFSSIKHWSRLLFVPDYQNTKPKICDAGEYILDIIIIKFAAVKTKHAQPWTFAECPTFSVETQKKQTTETKTL